MATTTTFRHLRPTLAALATFVALLFAGPTQASAGEAETEPSGGWTTGWRGPNRNGVFPGKGVPTTWSDTANVVWRFRLPDDSTAEPIAVGGKVFALSGRDRVHCLDIQTGKELWTRRVGKYEILGKQKGLPPEEIAADDRLWEISYLHGFLWTTGNSGYSRGQMRTHGGRDPQYDAVANDMFEIVSTAERHPTFRFTKTKVDREAFANLAVDPAKGGARVDYVSTMVGEIRRYLKEKYTKSPDLPVFYSWGCDLAGATPCGDGRHLYVTFGEGQIACLDLDGNIMWAQVLTHEMKNTGTELFPSPLLVGDKLVIEQGRSFSAFDAKTGKQLWRKPKEATGYATGSPLHFKVGDLDVILTMRGQLVNAATGEDVGAMNMRMPGSEGCGCTPPHDGKGTFVFWNSVSRKDTKMLGVRLKPAGSGKVEPEILWETEGDKYGPSGCILGNTLLLPKDKGVIIDMSTGNLKGTLPAIPPGLKHSMPPCDGASLVVADGHLYSLLTTLPGGIKDKEYWGPDYIATMIVYQLGDPARFVSVNHLTMPCIGHSVREKFKAELGRDVVWKDHGNNTKSMMTLANPHVAGNRLLLRTQSMLFCLGDPDVSGAR